MSWYSFSTSTSSVGIPTCRERDVGRMDAQIRDTFRLRALFRACSRFQVVGGVTMPLTTKQLWPLRVWVRAVSGVSGMWR